MAYIKEGKIGISISLDGIGKWHDIYRRYKNNDNGSFKNVDKNIEKLLFYGLTPRILSTITNSNVFGLKELSKYCIDRSLGFRFSLYRETSLSEKELKSDNEILIENLKICYSYIKENLPKISLYQCHKFGDINLRSPKTRGCGMGVNNIIINSNGEICLCQYEMESPIGNTLKDNVVKAIKEQKRYNIREININTIPVCKDCKWRYTCGGGCPFLTKRHFGTFLHSSPYCEVYQAVLPVLVELYAYQLLKNAKEKI